jgi:ribonuclease BN (tRNA processing enzyme)
MRLIFPGVGSAFTTQRYWQSCMLVSPHNTPRTPEKFLLVDCGGDIRFSLGELGVTPANISDWIDGVYITHLHQDHIGGLEHVAYATFFNAHAPKPKLYVSETLLDDLWRSLRSGLIAKGVTSAIETFFEVIPLKFDFQWNGIEFRMTTGWHSFDDNKLMEVRGLHFNELGRNRYVYFSADTCVWDENRQLLNSQVIFHDCETYNKPSGVHAHYDELKALPSEIKKKMWLYHYPPHPKQDPIKDGFLGFVKKGQVFIV